MNIKRLIKLHRILCLGAAGFGIASGINAMYCGNKLSANISFICVCINLVILLFIARLAKKIGV